MYKSTETPMNHKKGLVIESPCLFDKLFTLRMIRSARNRKHHGQSIMGN